MDVRVAFFFCLFGFYSIIPVDSYSTGGPTSICYSLYPKHRPYYPQDTPTPYAMETNATEYSPNDTVSIRLWSPENKTFRGFQIRVRRVEGDTEELVGQFLEIPPGSKGQSWYPQIPGTSNCVTHSDPSDKDEIILVWKAPADSVGNVTITASFAHNYHEFWLAKNTLSLKAVEESTEEPFLATVSDNFDPIDYDDCGVNKGCFQYPRGCHGEGCRYLVTYRIDESRETAVIEMQGVSPGYLSLAFARDRLMPVSQTFSCLLNDEFANFQHGHNPRYHNAPDRSVDIRDIQMTRNGDVISCRFTRPLVMKQINYRTASSAITTQYDMRNPAFLHFGWGTVKHGAPVMDQHVELPLVSDDKINFADIAITSGTTIHTALAAHAVLGLVAWLALAGTFMIIARFYRPVFKEKLCGIGAWFQVHRAGMIILAVMAAISIIVIFVYLKAWTLYHGVHAVLGLITMGMSLLMILSGLVRPGFASTWRPIFNWGHRLTGLATWMFAALTCSLGANVSLLMATLKDTIITIVVIWIFFQILWAIMLELLLRCYFHRDTDATVVSKEGQMSVQKSDKKSLRERKNTIFTALFAVYVVITMVFVIASSYYICLY